MTKHTSVIPVILAGGSGSRLWPLSRNSLPKQFINLISNDSLFVLAIKRAISFVSNKYKVDDVIVVTNEEHKYLVAEQVKKFKNTIHIILEPCGKNTAPAATVASLLAQNITPNPILLVLSADQIIGDIKKFHQALCNALRILGEDDFVIMGVKPSHPETGYGYIKKDKKSFDVLSFTEKPNEKLAKKYIKSNDYLWNSGIFLFRASVWERALNFFNPGLFASIEKAWKKRVEDGNFISLDLKKYELINANSIDYAVIEKCPNSKFNLKAVTIDANWSDLGSWGSLDNLSQKDSNNNSLTGDVIAIDTKNSFIKSTKRLTTAIGLNNIIIIETADAVLVCDKKFDQNIKLLINHMSSKKRSEAVAHRKVHRPWGWFDVLEEGLFFKVKRIYVKPLHSLSLQSHKKRAEHWVVIQGEATIVSGGKMQKLKINESTFIAKAQKHRLSNETNIGLEIIEVQTGEYLGEDDIVRYDDKYGRF